MKASSTAATPVPEIPPQPKPAIESIIFKGGHLRVLQEGEVAYVIEREAGPICVNVFWKGRPRYSVPYHAIEMIIFDEYDDDDE